MTKNDIRTHKDDVAVAEIVLGKPNDRGYPGWGWAYPKFVSAPSWESDGIILEWVQGQDDFFIQAIADEVERLIVKREGIFPAINNTLRLYLTYGKKGDYATALLAVLKDKGDG